MASRRRRPNPALKPEIAVPAPDGLWHEYQFPCNVSVSGYVADLDAFASVGRHAPPRHWTIGQFEAYGREYVRRANAPGKPMRKFFAASVEQAVLRRAFGASELNETMTASTVDNPRSVAARATTLQWQDVNRLIHSTVDRAGFASDSGYGGQEPQLLNAGQYAMIWTGRHMLIQFRRFDIDRAAAGRPLRLGVSEMPYDVFPNTSINTRAASIYAGGGHQDLAVLFPAYLASEAYNAQVVRDADALLLDPLATRTPAFLRPTPDLRLGVYANTENGLHGAFADMVQGIAVAGSHSPFVLQAVVVREVTRAEEVAVNHVHRRRRHHVAVEEDVQPCQWSGEQPARRTAPHAGGSGLPPSAVDRRSRDGAVPGRGGMADLSGHGAPAVHSPRRGGRRRGGDGGIDVHCLARGSSSRPFIAASGLRNHIRTPLRCGVRHCGGTCGRAATLRGALRLRHGFGGFAGRDDVGRCVRARSDGRDDRHATRSRRARPPTAELAARPRLGQTRVDAHGSLGGRRQSDDAALSGRAHQCARRTVRGGRHRRRDRRPEVLERDVAATRPDDLLRRRDGHARRPARRPGNGARHDQGRARRLNDHTRLLHYTEGFETGRLGYSSAVSWTMFLLVLTVTAFNWKVGNRYVNE